MTTDVHALCRERIDDALVARLSPQDDRVLAEHVRSCRLCAEYLDTSTRVLAGLESFRFEVDPMLEARVRGALWARAEELKNEAPVRRGRLVGVGVMAILFAIAGSLFDLRMGELLASLLHLRDVAVRQELLTFWVLPSLLPLMLFPLLPVLANRKERLL